jgi:hypothetical protein
VGLGEEAAIKYSAHLGVTYFSCAPAYLEGEGEVAEDHPISLDISACMRIIIVIAPHPRFRGNEETHA